MNLESGFNVHKFVKNSRDGDAEISQR